MHHPLFTDLHVSIGKRTLVQGASLTVHSGTITVLMGPSGAGKSILADVAFGLRPRDRSDPVTAHGEIGVAARNGALVFQRRGGLAHLSVADNLALANPDGEDNRETARLFGLPMQRKVSRLSGGQNRALVTSQSLVAGREIVWLDEPAAGMDLQLSRTLAEELRRQASEHDIAFVVTTHQPTFAAAVADDVHFLSLDGSIQAVPFDRDTDDARALEQRADELFRAAYRRWADADGETAERVQPPMSPVSWMAFLVSALLAIPTALLRSAPRATLMTSLYHAAWKGIGFYPVVGSIFGAIFVLVFEMSFEAFSTGRMLVEYGPTIVLRVSPPLAAILVAARAGSAISAWLGQITVTRQLDALQILGANVARSVTGPAWLGLGLGGILGTLTFALALTGVFALYLAVTGDADVGSLLARFETYETLHAAGKTAVLACIVAAVSVTSAVHPKFEPDEVATGITRGIMYSTIWVMLAELFTLAVDWVRP